MNWSTWGAHLLALVLWREARGEGIPGMRAVALCMKNRVDNPKWWGATFADVCTKKWQISSMTDPRDRQLATWPTFNDVAFSDALGLADQALKGTLADLYPGADSYYDISIPAPKWATESNFIAAVGRLRLHNTDGDHPDNLKDAIA